MGDYLEGFGKQVCQFCKLHRTPQGYDGCIGELENVKNACCGHGETKMAYIQFNHNEYIDNTNKIMLKGEQAVKYIAEHKSIGNLN